MTFDFTASASEMSESFHLVTDNYTCDVNIDVRLHEESDWGHSQVAYDYFHFRGPCEQPPSPFTLTYDGVEWEWDLDWEQFENCTQSDGDHDDDYDGHNGGQGWECEEGYDWDGDGQSDYYNYYHFPEEDCEWSEDDSAWYCVVGRQDPQIEEGEHSMELHVEGLDVGATYRVHLSGYQNMYQNSWDWEEGWDFNATSELEVLEFMMETSNQTCGVHIHADLYEVDEESGWDHHVFGDYFGFRGPCE